MSENKGYPPCTCSIAFGITPDKCGAKVHHALAKESAPSESPTPASEEALLKELSARIWCDPVINSPFDNAMRVEVDEFVVRELQPLIRAYVAERGKEAERLEREWFRDNGCWNVAMKRIAELKAKR